VIWSGDDGEHDTVFCNFLSCSSFSSFEKTETEFLSDDNDDDDDDDDFVPWHHTFYWKREDVVGMGDDKRVK